MWAARLMLSSKGLKKLLKATSGHGCRYMTHNMVVMADADIIRLAVIQRRHPVPRGSTRIFAPGECMEYDAWGPAGAVSANGNERFDLHAICVTTGYTYARKSTNHTASTVLTFLADVQTYEHALDHKMLIVRMDRAPEHVGDEMAIGMRALRIKLEHTPRYHHEGVGNAESANDPTQRMAEASTRRANLTLGYILDARMFAWHCRNLRCAADREQTRHEAHTGLRPDFARMPKPYLFGARCIVLQDPGVRGAKGSLTAPRSVEGTFIGIEGSAYLVRLDSGGLVRERHIRVTNERQLLMRGMPAGSTAKDDSAQTESHPHRGLMAVLKLAKVPTARLPACRASPSTSSPAL